MSHGSRRFSHQHGTGSLSLHRLVALCSAQAIWLLFGLWLFHGSLWPSTCTPDNIIRVYLCSIRLPESGHWREAVLLTWLWATPILVGLEISRRLGDRMKIR